MRTDSVVMISRKKIIFSFVPSLWIARKKSMKCNVPCRRHENKCRASTSEPDRMGRETLRLIIARREIRGFPTGKLIDCEASARKFTSNSSRIYTSFLFHSTCAGVIFYFLVSRESWTFKADEWKVEISESKQGMFSSWAVKTSWSDLKNH